MDIIERVIAKNGLVSAFLLVGIIMLVSFFLSKKLTKGKIPGAAIAVILGLGCLLCPSILYFTLSLF